MSNLYTSTSNPAAKRRLAEHEAYWRRFGVHRATRQAELPAMSTGSAALDRLLPGGGYPIGAVTELLSSNTGMGELSLLLHGLAARMAAHPRRQLAFVAPPGTLHAAALAQSGIDCARLPIIHCRDDNERVWCVEQMAHAHAFTAFVVWGDSLDTTALRRLQLAAEKSVCPVFVYRDIRRAAERSPAALRVAITAGAKGQRLEILKCRGPAGARAVGLQAALDQPWQMRPAPVSLASVRAPASNESTASETRSHVARPAFPPLGTR
ncbi:hypothetical protein SADO_12633 [Salinisphaera dokdonensis CL-ES53]|uniref:Translesion DNA synthesis-associated protein ImuA n=1 Tax=Salinisphaera dokdonensis CL-ES53 TaxID=1304272 RepID=A0ABV2B2H1_9GAMM